MKPPADQASPRPRRRQGRPLGGEAAVGRDSVLSAATRLIQDQPPAQVTIAAVAREAHVDPALVRYYFGSREALLFLHLVALVIALIALSFQTHDWFIISATGVVVFFTTAMLAHRTLYEARPAPAYLTEFYLWMSFGGALGGMFTALVAPRLFSEVYEYPLLLALSMACQIAACSAAVGANSAASDTDLCGDAVKS